ncbi:hypothetical protein C2U70_17340 [Bradyrhizobium guangdongense]|uniref:hypothetical protein n=1 Tax=Bradyrhizobium guangdongense TaxID=1325090 RepID=UPI00112EC51C|nr:hypothetical protein [Bradyrhizobium guangdongense]TPQ34359.1 hypothetical protein C2U70_17340 [Bradyrhizobium guangdongense]
MSDTQTDDDANKSRRQQPTEALPTVRIAFQKQQRCLLAYGYESNNGSEPVKIEQVAKAVEMNPSTVSLANPFFEKIGLISKVGRAFAPSSALLEYARAYRWSQDTAPIKLQSVFAQAWFTRTLQPKLQMRDMAADEAIQTLADRANALPEYKSNLSMILDYMEWVGLITREGDRIAWVWRSESTAPEETKMPSAPEPTTAARAPEPTAQDQSSPGAIRLSVNVSIDMAELSGWSAERITAFFSGVAQVLAAQKGSKP